MINCSVYDLAYNYIKINNLTLDKQEKREIINTIMEVLDNGANSNDINKHITKLKNNSLEHKKYFKCIETSGNLLNSKRFYYHNELRVVQEQPIKFFDINTGIITSKKQDYFLEMKASYTIDDLFDYISKKEYLFKSMYDKAKAMGALKFLLKKYDIDFLLFLVDTANCFFNANMQYLKNILDITNYEEEALKNYQMKTTENYISGTNHIVFKKRML